MSIGSGPASADMHHKTPAISTAKIKRDKRTCQIPGSLVEPRAAGNEQQSVFIRGLLVRTGTSRSASYVPRWINATWWFWNFNALFLFFRHTAGESSHSRPPFIVKSPPTTRRRRVEKNVDFLLNRRRTRRGSRDNAAGELSRPTWNLSTAQEMN